MGIVGGLDVVNAVAVVTDGFVGFYGGVLMFKEGDGGAVKVSDVGFEDIGGDVVLVHEVGIGVAFGAKLRGTEAEEVGGGVADVVYAVAVDAGGDVWVALV